MKKIAIFGSTGSIGRSTLKILQENRDLYEVEALAAATNIDLLEKQAHIFKPKKIAVFDDKQAKELRKRLSYHLPDIKVLSSIEGLVEIAKDIDVDIVMMAISGSIALMPTIEAIKSDKVIGLANKEVLVAAGEIINKLLKKSKSGVVDKTLDYEIETLVMNLYKITPEMKKYIWKSLHNVQALRIIREIF